MNGMKFKMNIEYFEFSTRWNQAELTILPCLKAISIQSLLPKKIMRFFLVVIFKAS